MTRQERKKNEKTGKEGKGRKKEIKEGAFPYTLNKMKEIA